MILTWSDGRPAIIGTDAGPVLGCPLDPEMRQGCWYCEGRYWLPADSTARDLDGWVRENGHWANQQVLDEVRGLRDQMLANRRSNIMMLDEIEQAVEERNRAQARVDELTWELYGLCLRAFEGGVTKTKIAKAAGITPITLNTWLLRKRAGAA